MEFNYEKNRIFLEDAGHHTIAEVTFPPITEHQVLLDHTFVDPSLRGQGVAGKLMEAAGGYFRENHLLARISCSYAAKWFDEHPEYSDVIIK
jgi:predicted GNAT family acetyltransferase